MAGTNRSSNTHDFSASANRHVPRFLPPVSRPKDNCSTTRASPSNSELDAGGTAGKQLVLWKRRDLQFDPTGNGWRVVGAQNETYSINPIIRGGYRKSRLPCAAYKWR